MLSISYGIFIEYQFKIFVLKHFDVVVDDSTKSIMIDILVPLFKVDNKAENARHFLYKRFHEKLELSIFLATKFPGVS